MRSHRLLEAQVRLLEAKLATEESRVEKLLALLMAKSAPAEYGAYVAPLPEFEAPVHLWSEDGLTSVEVEDED